MKDWLVVRDILLFLGGSAGLVHETLFQKSDRPELLVVFAAMVGLPTFLQADSRRRRNGRSGSRDGE